ncbi:hypothetical protein M758_UG109900 [Ceratodon purpureus]|nr:hypothetical protein M758_UG109900 [Ceratodon purpureus]
MVYENMMSVGPPLDETTHRLLLSHFQILLNSASKRGICKWALQLLDKMQEKGIEPDMFAWNAALIACARAHEPASAIEVFQKMTAHGQKPGLLSYGALLSALEKGNLNEKAEQDDKNEKDMEVDTPSVAGQSHVSQKQSVLPEVEIFCYLLVTIFLIDQKQLEEAKSCSAAAVKRLQQLNR